MIIQVFVAHGQAYRLVTPSPLGAEVNARAHARICAVQANLFHPVAFDLHPGRLHRAERLRANVTRRKLPGADPRHLPPHSVTAHKR